MRWAQSLYELMGSDPYSQTYREQSIPRSALAKPEDSAAYLLRQVQSKLNRRSKYPSE